jgi:hypothetical protein
VSGEIKILQSNLEWKVNGLMRASLPQDRLRLRGFENVLKSSDSRGFPTSDIEKIIPLECGTRMSRLSRWG